MLNPGYVNNISGIYTVYGTPMLTRDKALDRLHVCGLCDKNKGGICSYCEMPIKSFIYFMDHKCPLNLWPELDIKKEHLPEDMPNVGCCPRTNNPMLPTYPSPIDNQNIIDLSKYR